ncbi:hypothetical protein B7463_g4630, partial [Scytalidium lignicola]
MWQRSRSRSRSRSRPREKGTSTSTSPHSSAHGLVPGGGGRHPPMPPPPSTTGLTVLYSPTTLRPSADIVFIHGLRGNSMKTWTYGPQLENFWPRDWLPNEPGLESTRIWTFGYDSDWLSLKSPTVTSIFDFADMLLFYLKYAIRESQENSIGEVPLIFVAHSMGGLVVKEAYIFGKDDLTYRELVRSTCAIIFMATPHRGADLAKVLRTTLRLLDPTASRKAYVNDLVRNSPLLQRVNMHFKNVASKMGLVSFYETIPTSLGLFRRMILDKDSSTMGCENELTVSLPADHRNVPRFSSTRDVKYISFLKVLTDLVTKYGQKSIPKTLSRIQAMLATKRAPEEDRAFYDGVREASSCRWILMDADFIKWSKDSNDPLHILWIYGRPGSGKSVLASFLIEYLSKTLEFHCQYFYFRYDDQAKISLDAMIRSIAYQAACQFPDFRQMLNAIAEDGSISHKVGARLLWDILISGRFAQIRCSRPVYWVIDAMDEISDTSLFLSLLTSPSLRRLPLRVAILSRREEPPDTSFNKFSSPIVINRVAMDPQYEDLKAYIVKETDIRGNNPELKQAVIDIISKESKGNFLWAREAIKEVRRCHTASQIYTSLKTLPIDLVTLYKRMVIRLSSSWGTGDRELARSILGLIACSRRPLALEEIQGAIWPDDISLDLKVSIRDICGDFIEIDNESRVMLAHDLVGRFLFDSPGHELSIKPATAHYTIFSSCINALSEFRQSPSFSRDIPKPFTLYAATFWHQHLLYSQEEFHKDAFSLLTRFFCSKSVMHWIYLVASHIDMETLIDASTVLTNWLSTAERRSDISNDIPMNSLEQWTEDLPRLVRVFGDRLVDCPNAIYDLTSPLCPSNSSIQKYGSNDPASSLTLTGFEYRDWDDADDSFAIAKDCGVFKIVSGGKYFAIATASMNSHVDIFRSTTNQKIHDFDNNEPIVAMQLSHSGSYLVTYGSNSTKIWDISSGCFTFRTPNPNDSLILDINFSADDDLIFTISDDGLVRYTKFSDPTGSWVDMFSTIPFNEQPSYGFSRELTCACFSPDSMLMAVAYNGCYLAVFEISSQSQIAARNCEDNNNRKNIYSISEIKQVTWIPGTKHVVGLYTNGNIFKWRPYHEEFKVVDIMAFDIQCSPDGKFLATKSSQDSLKFWDLHNFTLMQIIKVESGITDIRISRDGERVYIANGPLCVISKLAFLNPVNKPRNRNPGSMATKSTNIQEIPLLHYRFETLTALSICPKTSAYCTGDVSGCLKIGYRDRDRKSSFSTAGLHIKHIIWSDNGRYVAIADATTSVYILQIDCEKSKIEGISKPIVIKSRIQQLLFTKSGDQLLIVVSGRLILFSLSKQAIIKEHDFPDKSYLWMNHPQDNALIGISCSEVSIIPWNQFPDGSQISLIPAFIGVDPQKSYHPNSATRVTKVLTTPDASVLLMKITTFKGSEKGESQYAFMYARDLASTTAGAPEVSWYEIDTAIQDRISEPLGFINGSKKVGWITCSLWRPYRASIAVLVLRHIPTREPYQPTVTTAHKAGKFVSYYILPLYQYVSVNVFLNVMAEGKRKKFLGLLRRSRASSRESARSKDSDDRTGRLYLAPTSLPTRPKSSESKRDADTSSSAKDELWDEALRALGKSTEDGGLKAIIKEFARNDQGTTTKILASDIKVEMDNVIKNQQSDSSTHRVLEKTISILNRFVSVVDVAVSFDPVHAALPWAAIRTVLVTVTANGELKSQLIGGIANVTSLTLQCDTYCDIYLKSPSSTSQLSAKVVDKLKKAVVQAYTSSLLFLSFAIHRQRSWSRAVDAAFKLEDVHSYIRRVQESEDRLYKAADDCEKHCNHQNMDRVKQLQQLAIESHEITKDVKQLLVNQNEIVTKTYRKIILDKLSIAEGAEHDSHQNEAEGATCYKNTRVDLLKEIYKWADSLDSRCMFWLQGMAGTGKSTISRTVAYELAKKGVLGASFFFKRGRGDRGKATRFFTTIVTQLIRYVPDLALHVSKVVEENPNIGDKGLSIQFEKLIMEPLKKIDDDRRGSYTTVIIVVDALDECDPESDIMRIIGLLPQVKQFTSVHLKFFLTSRPEYPIDKQFKKIGGSYEDLILHEVHESVITHDISIFFKLELSKIRDDYNDGNEYCQLDLNWPDPTYLLVLVKRAVPLFIFAKTLCRFIEDRESGTPEEQLQKLLGDDIPGEDSKLYSTYLPILNQMLKKRTDSGVEDRSEEEKKPIIKEFREIVGTIVMLAAPLSIRSLASLIGLSEQKIAHRLSILRSVLDVPPGLNSDKPVKLLHLSFRDFLVGPRPKTQTTNPFWIDEQEAHKQIAGECLELLMKKKPLRKDICGVRLPGTPRERIEKQKIADSLPPEVQYACLYWVFHLKSSNHMIEDEDQIPVQQFLECHFLHWLEALSLLGRISESIRMIGELQSITEPEKGVKTMGFLQDARRFVLSFRSIIDLAPLQLYPSALVFAPEGSVVRKASERFIPDWIIQKPEMEQDWDPCLLTLECTSGVNLVAFSPDSKLLASGLIRGTIKIWDVATGEEIQTLQDSEDWVREQLIFSPNSKLVASRSQSGVDVWDAIMGHKISEFEKNSIEYWVDSVAWSPDGRILLAKARNYTDIDMDTDTDTDDDDNNNPIEIWDAEADRRVYQLDGDGFVQDVRETELSTNAPLIHVTDKSGDMRVLGMGAEQKVFQHLGIEVETIRAATLSADSKLGAVAIRPKDLFKPWHIEIWDVVAGQRSCTIGIPQTFGPAASVSHLTIAGHLVAGVVDSSTICVWDIDTGEIRQQFPHHLAGLNSVAFSVDSRLLASGSYDGTVRIWDATAPQLNPTVKAKLYGANYIAISPDRKLLQLDSRRSKIWDINSVREVQSLDDEHYISPNFEHVASYSPDKMLLEIRKRTTGERVREWTINSTKELDSIFWINARLVGTRVRRKPWNYEISQIWDVVEGQEVTGLFPPPIDNDFSEMTASADCTLLAVCFDDRIQIWDMTNRKSIHTLEHTYEHRTVPSTFSSDSKYFAYSSKHAVVVGDVASWQQLQRIEIRMIRNLSFDTTSTCLYTDLGTIALDFSSAYEPSKPRFKGYGISSDSVWITWNGENVLWLPPEYRSQTTIAMQSIVALACNSKPLLIFRFASEDEMPIA